MLWVAPLGLDYGLVVRGKELLRCTSEWLVTWSCDVVVVNRWFLQYSQYLGWGQQFVNWSLLLLEAWRKDEIDLENRSGDSLGRTGEMDLDGMNGHDM